MLLSLPSLRPSDKSVTTFREVDYKTGKILMTVAAVPLSPPNRKYRLALTSQFQGTMTAPADQCQTGSKEMTVWAG